MTELIKLSDYFQPLNITTLSYYLGLLIFFDILGTFVKKKLISFKQDNSRIINWLIGLSFFVFVWFLLRFFIPPQQTPLILSILGLLSLSLPSYLKNQEHKKILSTIWELKFPLLIIVPFLPAVFVKASLPPYYSDEMAYQFISPSALVDINTWNFVGKFYQNLPRNFNYFFTLAFSLTKTYSVVRLFHFSILVTAIIFAYQKIKNLINFPAAFLFVFIFFSLPISTIQAATVGFVDVATYSFILIAVLSTLEYFSNKTSKSLFISALFWALALGNKYTVITTLIAFTSSFFLVSYFFQKNLFKKILTHKILTKIFLLMFIFGGYWYLKNLIVFGNPIYPFIFRCYRFAEICQSQMLASFNSWTTPVNLTNLPQIFNSLFPANPLLLPALILSSFLVLLNKNKKTKQISLVLISTVTIELVLLKYTSGFYTRYHQHLQLILLLLIVTQLANQYKSKLLTVAVNLFYVSLLFVTAKNYINTVKNTNSLNFLTQQEINYSLGKLDIYGWTEEKFPNVIEGIYWCENPPLSQRTELVRLDPDMIWFRDEGFMRSFLTNCYINESPPLDGLPLDQVLKIAKQDNLRFWTVSVNPCILQEKVTKRLDYEGDYQLYLRHLNNIIVCNSQEVKPNLYYFDYEKL